MANIHKGEIEFSAGDKTYTLRLSTNQLVEAEALGVDLTDPAVLSRVTALRSVFWAGLKGGGHACDLEAAGDLMTEIGLPQVSDLVGRALAAAFPPAKEAENPQKASPEQTGTPS